ncbi:MAG TPA: arylsulfatase [Alphaproteobacteria bacterium]|nr:arylsulfatase [Alphaproteobacteria bacterium]
MIRRELAILALVFGLAATTQAQSADKQWHAFPQPKSAPAGAPNVLLIMTDDVGFGASSPFGGPIATPTFAALAASGLRYTQFHTTAMCSPTRAALLTGRNHHAVGSGVISDMSTDQDGYTSVIPDNAATIGEVLLESGYATAWIGKNHNTPQWENTPVGPFNHWPNAMGFDYFYGFNAADTDQYAPALIENRNAIDPPKQAGYILDRDLADHAVHWLDVHHSLTPDKPFFLYLAPGSAHMPNQAPADWIAKYRGRFDMGWDTMREMTFARQKALGIVPKDATLTPRPDAIPAWNALTDDQKRVYAREMEVYAAQLAFADDQIGRVVTELKATGDYDNTLIVYIQGDNGAAAEILDGSRNYAGTFGGAVESAHEMLAHLDELGGPRSSGLYPVGWAWGMDTPFQWAKQVASHFGGTRNGMVLSWPGHIPHGGELRTQFHHVIDIAPTIYEAAHIVPPAAVHGEKQQPLQGVSMLYSITNPDAPSTHRSQYFEMLGNAAFYQDGWIASTTPIRLPWAANPMPGAKEHAWELYDMRSDFSQADNLAARYPDRLKTLQAGFMEAAKANQVLPLDDSFITRFNPDNRPSLFGNRTHFTYYPGATRYSDKAFPSLRKDWRIDAELDVPNASADGTIVVQGDRFSGWGLSLAKGTPRFIYRIGDRAADLTEIKGPAPLTPGRHVVGVAFAPVSGGALVTLTVDGAAAASATVPKLGQAEQGDVYVGRAGAIPLTDDAAAAASAGDAGLRRMDVTVGAPK